MNTSNRVSHKNRGLTSNYRVDVALFLSRLMASRPPFVTFSPQTATGSFPDSILEVPNRGVKDRYARSPSADRALVVLEHERRLDHEPARQAGLVG